MPKQNHLHSMAQALNWYSRHSQGAEVPHNYLQYLMILEEDDSIMNYLDTTKTRSRDEFMACSLYLGGFSIEDIQGADYFAGKKVTLIQIDKWIEGNKRSPGMAYVLLEKFWEKNRFYCEFCHGRVKQDRGYMSPYPLHGSVCTCRERG